MKIRILLLSLTVVLAACSSSEDEPAPVDDTGVSDTGGEDAQDGSDADTQDTTDTDTEEPGGIVVPAVSTITEYREHELEPVPDLSYLSKETTYFHAGSDLDVGSLQVLRILGDQVFVGGDQGLASFVPGPGGGTFTRVPESPAVSFTHIGDALVSWNDSQWLLAVVDGAPMLVSPSGEESQEFSRLEANINALTWADDAIWAATDEGLWMINPATHTQHLFSAFEDFEIRDIAAGPEGQLLFATNKGLVILGADREGYDQRLPSEEFLAVAWCPNGDYAAVSQHQLVVQNDDWFSVTLPEHGGLPADNHLSIHCSDEGVFVGHEIGASLMGGERNLREHYTSMRWMLGAPGLGVAVDSAHSRWILSTDGLTRIDLVPRTLAERAAYNHDRLDEFRRLGGFISSDRDLVDWFSLEGSYLPDKDNDGQWTQGMVGAWMFAYGTTGDEAYCDAARLTMDNMLKLLDYPCYSFEPLGRDCGFVARSYVRDDEGAVYEDKLERSNWIPIEPGDGHTYRWKNDTSSDEIDGHNFGFPLYYDFCATDEEKVTITAAYTRMIDYIINNDYLLIDLSGEKTTYGHWNPERISSCVDGFAQCLRNVNDAEICATACFGGGFLNGMQILGGLLAAWHMSGNEFYYLEYERLIREHRYDEVITNLTDVHTLHSWSIENHSDHELMMLAYHTLIRYEPNEDRRLRWQAAMLEMYATERVERQPLWVAFVAGLTGHVFDLPEALDSLQRYPWDTREWLYDNSHRTDITPVGVLDRRDHPQMEEVLPYDEMGYTWWHLNPHRMIQGGAMTEAAPTAYLIAYWALRYYGLLGEEP